MTIGEALIIALNKRSGKSFVAYFRRAILTHSPRLGVLESIDVDLNSFEEVESAPTSI